MQSEQQTVSIPQAIQRGLEHYQAGRLPEAERLYQQVLQIDPNNPEALHLLGVIAHQVGKNEIAVQMIAKALSIKPDFAEAQSNCGLALHELKRYEDALASYDRALSIKPGIVEALYNRGNTLHKLERDEEALASYDRALSIKPDYAEALSNRGNTLHKLKRDEEALASYDRALSIKPDFAEALSNRGLSLQELKRHEEALASYDRALSIKPDFAEVLSNCGLALHELKRYEAALARYDRALSIKPDFAEALYNRGNALYELKRNEEALASYDRALSIKPDYAEALYHRGNALQDRGQRDDAVASYCRALEFKVDFAQARWALTMCQLPIIANSESDTKIGRIAFAQMLAKLDNWFAADQIEKGAEVVGSLQPFYLAYQEENNRDLLSRYGALCHRLMRHWQESQGFELGRSTEQTGAGHVIRIGIISGYFRNHSVWNALVKGWIMHLNHCRFELHLFHLGTIEDQETSFARSIAARFVQGSRQLSQWAASVLEQPMDVLIYPEIGMDPMTLQLASMRLAPVQVATWGHPETTGLPTIDYFVSAEGLEPNSAQDNYTERLVRLPNLGCCYQTAPNTEDCVDLTGLGINPRSPSLLVCPGMPFKYAPEHDSVLAAIARELRNCQFVFFTHDSHTSLSELLQRRLRQSFTKAGLAYEDYVVFIPWQEKPAFYGLMRRADIYLDTIGFSGFNTAMQAVECTLPIVTREGHFLRGRLASGILNRMGLSELIAASEKDYIAIAVRICLDTHYREYIRQRIMERRHILLNDTEPVRVLEDFLIRASTGAK